MSTFVQFANRLSPLHCAAAEDLLDCLQDKTFGKGDYLLSPGETCRQMYFINKGLVKTFFYKDGKEFIMRFFPEHSMFTVLDSFLSQAPSAFMMVALEPTTVTQVSKSALDELCKKHHCMETFFRKLLSVATVNMMKRISEMLEENGTEAYNHFISENNHLLQRISLGDLAAYLGITQVSLSRIRAKK